MRNLDNYINEKLIIGKNIIHKKNKLKEPICGEEAYDYNDDKWEILDYIDLNSNSQEIKKFLDQYDRFGSFKEWYDDELKNNKEEFTNSKYPKYAVAAENDWNADTTVWLWGPDGLYYKE